MVFLMKILAILGALYWVAPKKDAPPVPSADTECQDLIRAIGARERAVAICPNPGMLRVIPLDSTRDAKCLGIASSKAGDVAANEGASLFDSVAAESGREAACDAMSDDNKLGLRKTIGWRPLWDGTGVVIGEVR
jgi:hypothetical protein